MRQEETKKNEASDAFSKVAHTHGYPLPCFDYTCSQVYYIHYNAVGEKHPFTIHPAANHSKHS